VRVDFATQKRTPKKSALFYRDLIARFSSPPNTTAAVKATP
jgi:beta-glucosidase/6-phospho-beta-glucosidase/beta-galactosidase